MPVNRRDEGRIPDRDAEHRRPEVPEPEPAPDPAPHEVVEPPPGPPEALPPDEQPSRPKSVPAQAAAPVVTNVPVAAPSDDHRLPEVTLSIGRVEIRTRPPATSSRVPRPPRPHQIPRGGPFTAE